MIVVEESLTHRNYFGKYAVTLAFIAVFVSFAGFAINGFAMFGLPMFEPGLMMSLMANMVIKAFTGFMGPALGIGLIRTQKRTVAIIYYFVIGVITMIPILIGGSGVLAIMLTSIGIIPFIPHVVGGTLCIAVAVLVGLWEPAPGSHGVEPIIRTIDSSFTSPSGTQARCPVCGHGLFGDERYCPGCAHDLRQRD